MRKSIVLLFILWSFLGYSQTNLYCLNDFAGWYRLSTINTTTGVITEIAPIPVVAFYVLGNKHCISTHDSTYTFSGHDGIASRLYTVGLSTGNILYNPTFSPSAGYQTVGLRYNCLDSSIYALADSPFGYALVKIDKTTGLSSLVSVSPFGLSAYVGDSFTLDVKRGLYHFFGLNGTNIFMYTVNINTGLSTVSAAITDNVTGLAYNCNDSTVYGLWEDGSDYKLERIIPSTGVHSTIGVLDSVTPGFVAESASINRNGMYTYRGFSNSNSLSLITVDVQNANVIDTVPFTNNVSGIDYYSCCLDSQITVGLNDLEKETLIVYPNPFVNEVEVAWGKLIKNGSLQLFDVIGSLIYEKTDINGKSYLLERGGISKGIYWVLIKDGSKFSWSSKVIAQ